MRSKRRTQATNAQTGSRPAFLKTRLSKRNASERHIRAASRTEAREIYEYSKNSPSGSAKCQSKGKRSPSVESSPPEMFQMKRKLADGPSDCGSNDSKEKKISPAKRLKEKAAPSGNGSEPQLKGGQAQKRRRSSAEENLSFAESPVIAKSLRSRERASVASESTTPRKGAENSGSSSKSSKSGTKENDSRNKDSSGPKSMKKGTKKRASCGGSPPDAKERVKMRKKDSGNAEKKEGKNTVEIKTEETSKTAADNSMSEDGRNVGRRLRRSSIRNEVKLKEEIKRNLAEDEGDKTNNNRETNAIEEANRDVAEVRIKENRSNEVENGVDKSGKLIEKNARKAGGDIEENRDEGVSVNTENTSEESAKDTVEMVKEGAFEDGEGIAGKEPRESNKTDGDSVCEKSKCSGDKICADLRKETEGVSCVHQVEEKYRTEKTLESEARMNFVYSSAEKMSVEGGESNSSRSHEKCKAAEGRENKLISAEMEDLASPVRHDSVTENVKTEKGHGDRGKDSSSKFAENKPELNQPGTHGPKSTSCERVVVPPAQNHGKSAPVAGKCRDTSPECKQEDKDDSDKLGSDAGTSSISQRSAAVVQSTSQSSVVTKCSQLPAQPTASTSSQKRPPILETPTPAEVSASLLITEYVWHT
ncbi:PHD finger protein rhinoceros-like [Penaeus indicus]|uniref:PHD finger protein rhinoceros-like n=1 Tax=Penaeus indicus TaxID=29960 RepID=UPI00300BFD2D